MQYDTHDLTIEQKVDILHRAKAVCYNWWVDILDCSKSFHRQKIEMSFEEIMAKFDDRSFFVIIHRTFHENYLEIGFSTMDTPDYFLWMMLDPKYIPEFTKGVKILL